MAYPGEGELKEATLADPKPQTRLVSRTWKSYRT